MASTSALLFLLFAALASTEVFAASLATLEAKAAVAADKAQLAADKVILKEDKQSSKKKGGGKSDPIITDFSGRTFGFGHNQNGAFFSVLSEEHHQMTMKLTTGTHGLGTYVGGIGVRYLDHQLIAERAEDDNLHVFLNGERLHMSPGETEQEHTLAGAHGQPNAVVTWQLAHPSLGQVAEFTDDLFSISVNVVAKSELEPAHLNFDILLLRDPEHELKGVVGGAYYLAANANGTFTEADDFFFHGDEEEYLMDGYFAAGHMHDAFGRAAAAGRGAAAARRQLIQSSAPAFPLCAHVGGAFATETVAAVAHVSGGSRKFGP